ncbi:MAG: hypothetical protein O3C40_04495 [Planctomycetota bacterium]|nr:hypothetical protein [Planctomycetota bacterium]
MQRVQVRLRGDGTVAARVRVVADDGNEYAPDNAAVRKTKRGESYFYATATPASRTGSKSKPSFVKHRTNSVSGRSHEPFLSTTALEGHRT